MKIAVIPARGGSKRIHRKNTRAFAGKPIIAHTIAAIRESALFDRIIVSTEDHEIAEVATAYGAEVPFSRPRDLADDHVSTSEVIAHATQWMRDQHWPVDLVCCVYATAFCVRTEYLLRGLRAMEAGRWVFAFSAAEYPSTVFRAFSERNEGGIAMLFPDHYRHRSQDLQTVLHDAGQFYWGHTSSWLEKKHLFGPDSCPIRIPHSQTYDIDTEDDWYRAERYWLFDRMGKSPELLGYESRVKRLALGTVQFGVPYGIGNKNGQIGFEESRALVRHAEAAGMDTLDTAIDYGESETRLGQIGVSQWQVVTKLPPVPDNCADPAGWVKDSIAASAKRLRVRQLKAVLLHRAIELQGKNGAKIYSALNQLKDDGVIQQIGVSIYAPDELDPLIPQFKIDLVQVPFNPVDHRLINSGWLSRLSALGIEVHVRSVFLQGLLLMPQADRPPKFGRWHDLWTRWQQWLANTGLTPLQACLHDAFSQRALNRVIVGVDSIDQLEEILSVLRGEVPAVPAELQCSDPDLVNPSHWIAL